MSGQKQIQRKVRTAYAVSTVSVSLVLFLLGAVAYLIFNARAASTSMKENVGMSLLLRDDISGEQKSAVEKRLTPENGVRGFKYLSKDDALKDYLSYGGEDFTDVLDENPLPASYEIYMLPAYTATDSLRKMERRFSAWEGVDGVLFQGQVVSGVMSGLNTVNLIMLFFGAALLVISIMLVNNTIRMSVFSKRFLINTMKLVGATGGFIRRPFVLKALWQGVWSALIAVGLIVVMILAINRGLPEAGMINDPMQVGILAGGIFVLGISICIIFTLFAVNKYIRLKSNGIYVF